MTLLKALGVAVSLTFIGLIFYLPGEVLLAGF